MRPNFKNGSKRNLISGLFLLAKKQLISVISFIAKKEIFKVHVTNYDPTQLQKSLADISNKINKLNWTLLIPKQEIKFKDTNILQALNNLIQSVNQLPKQFPEFPKVNVEIPKIQQISGVVKIANQKEFPLQSILSALKELEQTVRTIRLEIPPQKEIKVPEFPNTISIVESKAILSALKDVSNKLDELPKKYPEVDFPRTISIDNFPPQKYPMPVTHVSINSLNGTVKSRAVTVTTALTPLPGEVLASRRSIIIYNNSTQTVEIGGSTFTFGEGLPVPTNTYSPPMDASKDTILYGRVSSGTADIRTLEISDEASGR